MNARAVTIVLLSTTIPLLAHAQSLTGTSLNVSGAGPNTFYSDSFGPRVSIFPTTPTSGDPYISPDSVQIGGSAEWESGQLTVRGMPYGYFDTGALVSIIATDQPLGILRAGINGGYNTGPSAMAGDPDFDMVSLYNQTGNTVPRVTASSAITNADSTARTVSYTATTINFNPGLSALQMALLRRSMWVITNSVDLRVTASGFAPAVTDLAKISTGDLITVSSTGTIPAGLTSSTTYYAMPALGKLTLASSSANATAGIPIPITSAGTGNVSITDATISQTFAALVSLYAPTAGLLPPVNYFASTITGWSSDGTSVTVSGWTVPGGGNGAAGQVPPTDAAHLDTVRSSYAAPAVFIGSPTKAFLNNWIQAYVPNPSSNVNVNNGAPSANPANQDSQIHQFEGLELDQWDFSTKDYDASFHGLTIGYTPLGIVGYGTPSAHRVLPTNDSYDLELAGMLPTLLKFNESPTASLIQGGALLVKGNASPASALGSRAELMETSKFLDANNMRLTTWLQRDATGVGVNYGSLRLGLQVDGSQGNFDGSLQGQIVFNPQGYPGGVGFCGFSLNCGLYQQADGNVSLGSNMALLLRTPNGGVGGTLSTDTAGDTVVGTQVYGGALLATNTLTAQNGLNVTGGNANVSNLLFANAIYSNNQISVGKGAALVFQTSKGGVAGTVASDDAGDVLLGTQVYLGSAISTIPLVAQSGLSVTGGNVNITNGLSANTITSTNQIQVGKGAGLLFQTSKGLVAGTINSDNSGDVLLGTQVSGGTAIATIPLTAQNGVSVTGGAVNVTNGLTAGTLTSVNQLQIDSGAALWFQTSAGGIAGTVASDNAGDILLGTQVSGGATIATTPLVAQNGLTVTGGALKSNVPMQLPTYSYASLPASGIAGRLAFCADCLKTGETAGNGTGTLVFDDGHAHWATMAGAATH